MGYTINRTYILITGRGILTIIRKVLQFIQEILCRGKQVAGINFTFDQQKATEAILYLVSKAPVPNLYGICKFLYLADKASLDKYGRFIFGESYVAMKEGGTPSNAYRLLRNLSNNPTNDLKRDGYYIRASRPPELDYLSRSDIECLDQVLEEFGGRDSWTKRRQACHDTAWETAWDKKGDSESYPINIEDIAETLKNSDELIGYLSNIG